LTWAYLIFVGVGFGVELYLYIQSAKEGRNHIVDQLRYIISVAREVYDEIRGPHEKVNRLCGTAVGLVMLCTAAWVAISTLSSVLVPFDIQEWPQRMLFSLSACAAFVFCTLLAKRFNDWLISRR